MTDVEKSLSMVFMFMSFVRRRSDERVRKEGGLHGHDSRHQRTTSFVCLKA